MTDLIMVSCALRRPACAMLRNCGRFVKSNFLGGLPKLPRPGQCQNRRRRKGNGRTKLLKRPEDKDLNGPHTQAPACYQFFERAIESALSKDIAKPSRRGAAAQNFPRPDLTQLLPRSNADVGVHEQQQNGFSLKPGPVQIGSGRSSCLRPFPKGPA